MSTDRFTVCPYWPSARYWAVYMDGNLLDVYEDRSMAESYAEYMNTPNPALTVSSMGEPCTWETA